jgi:hypothetical protein
MGTRSEEHNNNQFEDRPPQTPADSDIRPTTFTRAATTTRARRRGNRDKVLPSSVSSWKSRKIGPIRAWDSQTTLTQIVQNPTSANEDGDLLDYEDDSVLRRDGIEVIDLEKGSSGDDAECNHSNRRSSKTQPSKTRDDRGRPSFSGRSQKSANLDKSAKKAPHVGKPKASRPRKLKCEKGRNKTLTQMDFVRRFIVLDDSDEDQNLAHIEDNPQPTKAAAKTSNNGLEIREHEGTGSGSRKKRKLEHESELPSSQAAKMQSPQNSSPSQRKFKPASQNISNSVTPLKHRNVEIPSSRSSENSPRKFTLSPSLRSVSRLHLEPLSPNANERSPEKSHCRARGLFEKREASFSLQRKGTIPETPAGIGRDGSLGAESTNQNTLLRPSEQNSNPDKLQLETNMLLGQISEVEPRSSARYNKTVVYETDAETDYGDFDDELPPLSSPLPGIPHIDERDPMVESGSIPNSDDSQQLPLNAPNSGTDLEVGDGRFSDAGLMSDASIYYRRPPQYTQFPTEPIPLLSTQKMAELFPTDIPQARLPTMTPPSQSPRKNVQCEPLCPQTQTQTQSQDATKISTEIVPESSPITRNSDTPRIADQTMPPPPAESVVLVESSQLVDKINRQTNSLNQRPGLGRVVTAGQWLTDSVMESIPLPPWMLSQDSVGEPYSDNV